VLPFRRLNPDCDAPKANWCFNAAFLQALSLFTAQRTSAFGQTHKHVSKERILVTTRQNQSALHGFKTAAAAGC